MNKYLTIYRERVITNKTLALSDKTASDVYLKFEINPNKIDVNLKSGKLLIIDPIYIADIYNENSKKEKYLKTNGVILNDFGGDVGGYVFRTSCGGIKIVMVYDDVDENYNPVFPEEMISELNEALIDNENLFCDSGSFIFLDYSAELKALFSKELSENKLFIIDLAVGTYTIGYEQWDIDDDCNDPSWKRNIIVYPSK